VVPKKQVVLDQLAQVLGGRHSFFAQTALAYFQSLQGLLTLFSFEITSKEFEVYFVLLFFSFCGAESGQGLTHAGNCSPTELHPRPSLKFTETFM
jgi:hypothetical protein